jgi:hypothetical protein
MSEEKSSGALNSLNIMISVREAPIVWWRPIKGEVQGNGIPGGSSLK